MDSTAQSRIPRQSASRWGTRRWARGGAGALVALAVLAVSGCSTQTKDIWSRGGLPPPASDRADHVLSLWQGSWIAALAVGVLVWGLIIWSVIAYRKRDDKPPVQTRYHMPIETLFTVVPFIMIAALFFFTVRDQNAILKVDPDRSPDQVVQVVGQQWAWTFNYLGPDEKDPSDDVWETGTPEQLPTLYLPKDKLIGFKLNSPDVNHSFFVVDFLFKMDAFPGKTNYFELTPTTAGTFAGKCAEMCGTYHSRMLFEVHVVSQKEYEAHLEELRRKGQTGRATGGADADTKAGLVSKSTSEETK